ncbi:glycosyltransferase [Microbacterium sp. SSW1-49]|uniref:Glycosyltransferase n=1 Tax=Microbacterium croceum TaxID=2851645 RepID=A0ABT0FCX5_9MICO|nr:glycosyltransferase [Microbacterium croceum]MCK2035913.1 glycosyltransferase [Microbacterium croceum]
MSSPQLIPPAEAVTLDFTSVSPTSGGVGVVAAGVAEGLAATGVKIRCLVNSDTHAAWASRLPDLAEYLVPVSVRLSAMSPWQQAIRRFVPRSSRLMQLLIGRVRAVRARSTSGIAGDGVVWQPFHRAPVAGANAVVTVHDLRVFEPDLSSPMDQEIITENVRRARAVICSWAHPHDSLLRRFPEAASKTFLIPLPVLNPGDWIERAAPGDRELRLLLPGFVTPHKNHEVLIRALPRLHGARAVFTGSEDGKHGAHLRALADELGVGDRIEWLGFVDSARLESEYAAADLLVMPTRWEAASGPIFEAIVRGLPFVASRIPPITAQLDSLGLSLPTFDCDSPEELIAAIRATVDDYGTFVDLLRPLSAEIRERTWKQMAEDYNHVFAWAAGRGDKPEQLMRGNHV